MNRYTQGISAYIVYLVATYCSRFFVVTLGHGTTHISFFTCLAAVAQTSFGATLGLSFALLKKVLFFLYAGHGTLATSLYLPTFAAMLYWSSSSVWVRCGIPLACMALFLMHPVGLQAGLYASYWLIPVLLYCLPIPSIVSDALGSAFIAHGVGSVLWVYFLPTTPDYWYMLMPVVFYERLLVAVGMLLAHTSVRVVEAGITTLYACIKKYTGRLSYAQ